MNSFGWHKSIGISSDAEQIKIQVKKLESRYRFWLVISGAIVSLGVFILFKADASDIPRMAFRLLIALAGVISCAATKLQAGISLSMYRIILAAGKH